MSEAAQGRIKEFVLAETNLEQGAFLDRGGKPDLYYTLFGLACADALGLRLPWRNYQRYLLRCSLGSLDIIHLCCWVKCALITLAHRPVSWSSARLTAKICLLRAQIKKLLALSEETLCEDPYMMFLALNISQDLKISTPLPYATALDACRAADGRSYGKRGSENASGVVSTTVAALLTMRQLGAGVDELALLWLAEQQEARGGFFASEASPLPDTLSTAVALFTLRVCGYTEPALYKAAAGYLRDHWLENGGFASVINDEQSDSEYTFYGLLAMGSLKS